MSQTLFTQVHCVAAGRVLLMKRTKEPNFGLWVAPGGKLESGEAPFECATRELKEETGLTALTLILRGVVSLVMPRLETPMLHFLYLVPEFSGTLEADEREGELAWHTLDKLPKATPTANALFLPHVFGPNEPFYQAKYSYDAEWKLLSVVEKGLEIKLD